VLNSFYLKRVKVFSYYSCYIVKIAFTGLITGLITGLTGNTGNNEDFCWVYHCKPQPSGTGALKRRRSRVSRAPKVLETKAKALARQMKH